MIAATDGGIPLLIVAKRGRVDKKSVNTALLPRTRRKTAKRDTLVTDGGTAYGDLTKKKNMDWQIVDAKTRKSPDGFHIQCVNNLHLRLNKWLTKFNGVASKYLQRYLDYFVALEKVKGNFKGRLNKMLDFILENNNVDMENILQFNMKP